MIKKVFGVAFFTGAAHLISIVTITYIINNVGEDVAGYIGIVDSYVLVISSVISFGIQLSINREIASQADWREKYVVAQGARLMLASVIIFISALFILADWDITKLVYLYAPIIALNGDYALYGAGKPLEAARLSFFRVFLPNLGLILVYYLSGESYVPVYILFVGVGILLSGAVAARINKVPYFVLPIRQFYQYYLKNYKVGLFQVSDVILLSGIIGIVNGFYEVATIGLVYGTYKLIILFKGGIRIINQTYFREFINRGISSKIDRTTTLFGIIVLVPTLIFPESTLQMVFDQKYLGKFEILQFIGMTMFFAALKATSSTYALLTNRDNLNLTAHLTGVISSIILCIVLSYTSLSYLGIPVGIMVGEVLLLAILGYGLDKFNYFKYRFGFVLRFLPLFIVFFAARQFIGDSLIVNLSCTVFLIAWIFAFYWKYLFKSSYIFQKDNE